MKNSAFFGALASRGTDYEMNGGQAARMAYDILFHGKKPCDIPLESGGYEELFLNKKILFFIPKTRFLGLNDIFGMGG